MHPAGQPYSARPDSARDDFKEALNEGPRPRVHRVRSPTQSPSRSVPHSTLAGIHESSGDSGPGDPERRRDGSHERSGWTPGPMEMQITDNDLHTLEHPIEQAESFATMNGNDYRQASQRRGSTLSPPKRSAAPKAAVAFGRQHARVQSAGRVQQGQNWNCQQHSGDKRPQSAEGFRIRRPGPHPSYQIPVSSEVTGRESNNAQWGKNIYEQPEVTRPSLESAFEPGPNFYDGSRADMPSSFRADMQSSGIKIWTYDYSK